MLLFNALEEVQVDVVAQKMSQVCWSFVMYWIAIPFSTVATILLTAGIIHANMYYTTLKDIENTTWLHTTVAIDISTIIVDNCTSVMKYYQYNSSSPVMMLSYKLSCDRIFPYLNIFNDRGQAILMLWVNESNPLLYKLDIDADSSRLQNALKQSQLIVIAGIVLGSIGFPLIPILICLVCAYD